MLGNRLVSPERALALRVVKAWLRLWKVYKADDPSVPRRWADGKLHKKVGDIWVIVSEAGEKPNMFGEKNDRGKQDTPQARAEAIKAIVPKEYTPVKGLDKDGVKKYLASFGNIEKETASGKISFRFPTVMAGKIVADQGFDTKTIVPYFGELFKNALFAYSENENKQQRQRPDGSIHKLHPDVIQYDNFVNKFSLKDEAGKTHNFYIRFVGYEKKNDNLVHSSFVSDIEIYEGDSINSRSINLAKEPLTRIDCNLQQFFDSVKVKKSRGNMFGERRIIRKAL
jgi:hypothetical protein